MDNKGLRILYAQIAKQLRTISPRNLSAYSEGQLWVVLELHRDKWEDIMSLHSHRGEKLKEKLVRIIKTLPNARIKEMHDVDARILISIDPDSRISFWLEPSGWVGERVREGAVKVAHEVKKPEASTPNAWKPVLVCDVSEGE